MKGKKERNAGACGENEANRPASTCGEEARERGSRGNAAEGELNIPDLCSAGQITGDGDERRHGDAIDRP